MILSLFTLHVKDMDKAMEFYNKLLGIPVVRTIPTQDGKSIVFLGVDGHPNLELIPSSSDVRYDGFSIGFHVDNLEEAKTRLSNSGHPVKKEFSPSPNTVLCFLDGPNGEEVELIYHKS